MIQRIEYVKPSTCGAAVFEVITPTIGGTGDKQPPVTNDAATYADGGAGFNHGMGGPR